jgi:hypothetical protein
MKKKMQKHSWWHFLSSSFLFSSYNIFKMYLYMYKDLLSLWHMWKKQDNHQKSIDIPTAQLSFDLNTQLVFFRLVLTVYINVNVYLSCIFASYQCPIFPMKKSINTYEYFTPQKNQTQRSVIETNKQINKKPLFQQDIDLDDDWDSYL